jgi:hypothetical protein
MIRGETLKFTTAARLRMTIAVLGAFCAAWPSSAASPVRDWTPDSTFAGSSLDRFTPLGGAEWRASGG